MAVYRHQGLWRYDFRKNGVRQRGSGFTSKQAAKTAEVMARKNLNKTNSDFIDLCENRLREVKINRTSKYFKENLALIEKLIIRWGKLKTITRDDVEAYLNEVAGHSHFVANKELRFIKALFNFGIDREWFSYNPAGKVKKFSVSRAKRYIPTEEDILKVFNLANPIDQLYLLVIAHTLGRITAVNQLTWNDVSFEKGYVSLFTRKSRNSDLKEIRIPMNKVLLEALNQIERKGEYVFENPITGRPYGYRSKFLKTLCRKAEVKIFTYHCLRHFMASKLDSLGVALTDIQKLLGHEKATTTDLYLQSLRGSTREAVKKLENLSPIKIHPYKPPI